MQPLVIFLISYESTVQYFRQYIHIEQVLKEKCW